MKPVTFLTLASCLAAGLAMGLLGCLKLHLARRGATLHRLSLLNLAALLMLVGCGFLADMFGVRAVLVGGSALLCLSLLGLAAAGPTDKAAGAVAAASLGASALLVATLLMVPRGLLGNHETAASLNFGLVFIALGGLLVPVLLDALLAASSYRPALIFFALASLAPAFLSAFVGQEEFLRPSQPAVAALVSEPSVWLAGLVFFFYAPLEAFVPVWVAAYLRSQGEPALIATRWTARFWVSLAVSRVLFGLVQHMTKLGDSYQVAFLVVPAVLAAIVLGNLAGTANYRRASGGLMMLGFFLGPVLPMLLAIVFNMQSTAHAPATAVGIFFACGAAGSLALAPLVSLSAQERHIRSALLIPLFISLALAAASLFFGLLTRGGR